MRRSLLRGLIVTALAIGGIATISGMMASQASASGGGSGGGGCRKPSFSGALSSINHSGGTITTTTTLHYNVSRVWNVNSSSVVTLNNQSAKLADLKVNDQVQISVDDQSLIPATVRATR